MNVLDRGIISLIRCAIDGTSPDVPETFDWKQALQLGKEYKLIPLMYYGIMDSKLPVPKEVMETLNTMTLRKSVIDQRQLFEISAIQEAFCSNGIDFMPLKGTLLKYLYPHSEMRPMSDADILIRMEQYPTIRSIMKTLGFQEGKETHHELIWTKPQLYVELHKCLIPSYNQDYFAYYGDGWNLARESAERRHYYEMSDEDQMIYLFTHFAKHYRDGGIGILHMVDLWVFLRNRPEMDQKYLRTELAKLQLCAFYDNIIQTIDAWFGDGAETQVTDFIAERMFQNGSWGTRTSRAIAEAAKASEASKSTKWIRLRRIREVIFPSVDYMKYRYPILQKCPVFLPFTWVARWMTTILFKRKSIKSGGKDLLETTDASVAAYQDELSLVGLSFHFKE